jgi:hypothetical protein
MLRYNSADRRRMSNFRGADISADVAEMEALFSNSTENYLYKPPVTGSAFRT